MVRRTELCVGLHKLLNTEQVPGLSTIAEPVAENRDQIEAH